MIPIKLWIVDLEATCWERGFEPHGAWGEIIEIGAVLFDVATARVESEYQTFVKPVLHPVLSDFCKGLTSIRQEEVDGGISLAEALAENGRRCKESGAVFASWGDYDKHKIQNSCRKFKLPYPFSDRHINLKVQFGHLVGQAPMGMAPALALLQLPLVGTHHRGIDDARNITAIAAEMLRRGWEPGL